MEPGATSVLILRFLALIGSLRVCHGKIKSFNVAKLTNGSIGFIQQTDEVALVCDTDAEVSTIEIIRIDDKTTVSMSRKWERSLTYHIKSVSCSDMGSYECVEDRTERMTADLVILNCPLQPCDGASVRRTIFVNTGENVKFSVCVLAVQKIADYALFNGEQIRKKNHTTDWTWDYERVVSPVLSISRYHIHVKRDQVDTETYGLLNLTISSDQGLTYQVNFTIILEPSGPPDCSTNITVTDFGHDYVTISWVPGLDRGSRQHFTVYQSTDNLAWLSPGVDTENSTVSVKGLSSNTSYYFRVVSLNQYQKSHDASTCQETVFVTTSRYIFLVFG
ncbi:unnamed protein product [Candidula unifasciata]|uniref:Fibronectin type-III domain-containing protein n=1 Tax=Candidula unifasciata TaxID=100452 RepID=A0A8S3Z3U2_9EUPU|nr:unnamed protein product [Candidula unifasciata]